jgi:hypothetical protein
MNSPSAPRVPYWHVWTDGEGVSHQSRRELTAFQLHSIKPPAAAQWLGNEVPGATIFVTVLPVGWEGDWHENPKPQWIIPITGRWYVETMDGQRVEMGPGEVSLGEDQQTRSAAGRQGHRSGTVGQEPAVLMIVQLPEPWPDAAARIDG